MCLIVIWVQLPSNGATWDDFSTKKLLQNEPYIILPNFFVLKVVRWYAYRILKEKKIYAPPLYFFFSIFDCPKLPRYSG